MPRPVLVLATNNPHDPGFYDRWREIGPVFRIADKGPIAKAIRVLVIDHRVEVDEALINRFENLEVVVSANTGHTHITAELEEHRIGLVSLRGEGDFLKHVKSVSEFVFALIFRLMRPGASIGHLLSGKTIGILGYGRIGKHVEQIARGFGMEVYPVDKHEGSIEVLFKESDFISVHVPESRDNEGLVSKKLIGLMKETAYFINTSRASVVDEWALYEALSERRIAGAALDVVADRGILPRDIPNLIVTPHNAGNTIEDRVMTDKFILNKTIKWLDKKDSLRT